MFAPSLSSGLFSTLHPNLQGLRHALLGDGRAGEAAGAQALRVDDVLARLHRHVLADLGGIAGRQLHGVRGRGLTGRQK